LVQTTDVPAAIVSTAGWKEKLVIFTACDPLAGAGLSVAAGAGWFPVCGTAGAGCKFPFEKKIMAPTITTTSNKIAINTLFIELILNYIAAAEAIASFLNR